jgi:hypothetical protein
MPFSTKEAYNAQRALMDLTLAPFDALQLPTQTLVNKYNMDAGDARTLTAQKVRPTRPIESPGLRVSTNFTPQHETAKRPLSAFSQSTLLTHIKATLKARLCPGSEVML